MVVELEPDIGVLACVCVCVCVLPWWQGELIPSFLHRGQFMSCPSKRSRSQRPRYASSRDQSTSHSLFALHVTVGARAREGGGGGGGERET